jgi:eukaryotic-like serine/threonine-protein kinase
MNPERWASVERILRSILALDPPERPAALAQACGGDEDLQREVESLLAHEPSTGGFLEGIAGDLEVPEAELPGWRAGPYRITRLIASGGMGSVWLAERDDDEYRKQVAVKVIKGGVDTEDVLRRFRQERQVQATLEHPNIVRLLDGGATDHGRPYLVMEYVEGKPILAHSQERDLSIPDRLRLFRKICGAVHYAHQNLVIHRDLKPGNILVTEGGEPKLLDFGVAKVLHPGAAGNEAELTSPDLRPMTLKYASPEQIRGEPVTTATDVYSLGVILCELLAGRGPYDVSSGSPSEYERAVCDRAPLPPSVAAARSDLPRTRKLLRGDLDAIVLKALRKEPWLRYSSVEQFSEDVERHLRGFPVVARRGTTAYRAARFLRRNAVVAAAVAAVFVSLVGGLVGTLRQARIAEQKRTEALAARTEAQDAAEVAGREARRSRGVAHFLQDVIGGASPRTSGRSVTAEQALDRAASRVHEKYGGDPGVEWGVHAVAGQTYMALGRYEDAAFHLREAVKILEAAGGGDTVDLASCLTDLGILAHAGGDQGTARELTERALRLNERFLGEASAEVARNLNTLGVIALALGEVDRSEEMLRKGLEIRRRLFGEEATAVAESHNALAFVARARGDLPGAERLARQALATRRKLLGDGHSDTVLSLDNLAMFLAEQDDFEAAEPLMRESVRRHEELAGPDHPDVAVALNNLSRVLLTTGRPADAEVFLEKALRIRRAQLLPSDERTITTARLLAHSQVALDEHARAEATLKQALAGAQKVRPRDDPAVQALIGDLVSLYENWGKPERVAELRAAAPGDRASRPAPPTRPSR